MSHVYVLDEQKNVVQLTRIVSRDEGQELQSLLCKNMSLLLGDQIDPEQKLRWLLIKREMPVVSPALGEDRYSLDFLLVDQLGIPTFVECKRFTNIQSRREVVGQMLEYAANGRHYWNASEMLVHAQATAGGEAELNAKVKELTHPTEREPDEFFAFVEDNLRKSLMRLIFFLDDSPLELRSIVEFLNDQMKDTEVLIIEARQYRQQGKDSRIIVPWLFGFTEAARLAKVESRERVSRAAAVPGEAAFWAAMETSFSEEQLRPVRRIVALGKATTGCRIRWLSSCMFSFPSISERKYFFAIWRNGDLEFNFAGLRSVGLSEGEIAGLAAKIETVLQITFLERELSGFPHVKCAVWFPLADQLEKLIVSKASLNHEQQMMPEPPMDFDGGASDNPHLEMLDNPGRECIG